MSKLSLSLLGRFQASLGSEPFDDFRTRKVQALLIYLAAEPQPHSRDSLLTLFWPGLPEKSARSNLRQVLYYLRQALPEVRGKEKPAVPAVVANRHEIRLNASAEVAVDTWQFESLLDRVHAHDHADLLLCTDCAGDLEEAAGFYRGDFLEDFYLDDSNEFEAWSQTRREYFRRRALDDLDILTKMAMRAGEYAAAESWARRQLEIDYLREGAYRQLMQVMALSGRREQALAAYESCRNVLAEELGMAPARRTTEIYEKIVGGDLRFDQFPRPGVRGYELKEQIGEGAYGAVYRAVQPAVQRDVAVKVIAQKYADDADFIRRFEAEAQTVAHLEHPYIVPLYDYWRDPEGAYLIMRYMRGGSLLSELEAGPWETERTAEMLEQIAAALANAHQTGVVHRDLKPGNILLDETGNAYLADFGIAKDLTAEQQLTGEGAVLGTLDYVSPEQITGAAVGPETDVYSLGAVIYETLTGERPFGDSTIAKLLYSHLHEPIPLVAATRPDVPPEIDAVLQKATAKQPAERYASALEMAAAFWGAVRGVEAEADGRGREALPALVEIYNPYKGLRAFQESDADDFFGREALVQQMVARLEPGDDRDGRFLDSHGTRFLALVGPSGSGKSSAVKAGLIPALRDGALPGSEKWFITEMVPGANPLAELELALWRVAVDPPPDLVAPMQRDTGGILRTIRRILPGEPVPQQGAPQLLLVIDQFEELFTLVEDEAQREFFLDSLLAALEPPRSPLRVIVTLRADFYDRPLQYQEWGRLLKQNTEIVLPLNRTELTWAVREPARRMGVRLEEGVAAAIVADVADQPGALPLLQYAMTELFEAREERRIGRAAYERLGGVLGALGRRAEAVFGELDAREQEVARQLFLRLITLGEGAEDTRRRVLRSELEALAEGEVSGEGAGNGMASPMTFVIDRFGAARFLTLDRDPETRAPTVEVAHEALLREWPRLRAWLAESRDDVRVQRSLAQAVAEWLAADRDSGFLLRDARLDYFDGWAATTSIALTADERALLAASAAAREKRVADEEARRQRELQAARDLANAEQKRAAEQAHAAAVLRRRAVYLAAVLAIAVILAVAAAILGRSALSSAQAAREEADSRATAEAVAISERDRAAAESEARATQEALALGERDRAEAQQALALAAEATAQAAEAQAIQEAELAQARELAASALVSLEDDPERSILLALRSLNLVYTPEAEEVLRQGMMASRVRLTIPKSYDNIGHVRYTSDGSALIGIEEDEVEEEEDDDDVETNSFVTMWDAATGAIIQSLPCGSTCSGGAISPDGDLLVAIENGSIIHVIDLAASFTSGAVQQVHEMEASPETLDGLWLSSNVSPDNKRLATTSWARKSLEVWDLSEGQLVFSTTAPLRWAYLPPSFSPDGTMVATSGIVSTVEIGAQIFDAATGELLLQLPADHRWPRFMPDGKRLVTHSWSDGRIRLWDLEESLATGEAQELYGFDLLAAKPPQQHVVSPDGNYLTDIVDSDVVLWRLGEDGAEQAMVLAGHIPGFSISAVFHPSGEELATIGHEGIRVWDITPAGQKELLTFKAHDDDIGGLAVSGDGTLLATGSADGTAALWDLGTGELLQRYTGHTERLQDVAFSPDGQYVITASDDRTVRVWDAATGEELAVLEAADEGYNVGGVFVGAMSARFSPDGRQIVTAGVDGTVRLWDADSYELLETVIPNPRDGEAPRGVTRAIFSPDGSMLAANTDGDVGDGDGLFRVWNVETGEVVLEQVLGPRLFGLDFSPDSKRFAVSSGVIGLGQIWDLETGEQLLSLPLPERTIFRIRFSADGSQVRTWGEGISVWDATNGQLLRTFKTSGIFSPDGSRLINGTDHGLVHIYVTDIDELVTLAESRVTRSLREEECQQYLHLETCP